MLHTLNTPPFSGLHKRLRVAGYKGMKLYPSRIWHTISRSKVGRGGTKKRVSQEDFPCAFPISHQNAAPNVQYGIKSLSSFYQIMIACLHIPHVSASLFLKFLISELIDTFTPNTRLFRLVLRQTTVTQIGLLSLWGRGREMQTQGSKVHERVLQDGQMMAERNCPWKRFCMKELFLFMWLMSVSAATSSSGRPVLSYWNGRCSKIITYITMM